jgi:hypothetical protein
MSTCMHDFAKGSVSGIQTTFEAPARGAEWISLLENVTQRESWTPPRPSVLKELVLIRESIAGDRNAFAALVQPYLPLFRSGIQRVLQDDQDTQDALDASLQIIRARLSNCAGNSKFATWAYRICLDEALLRRRSRQRRSSLDVAGGSLNEEAGYWASVLTGVA